MHCPFVRCVCVCVYVYVVNIIGTIEENGRWNVRSYTLIIINWRKSWWWLGCRVLHGFIVLTVSSTSPSCVFFHVVGAYHLRTYIFLCTYKAEIFIHSIVWNCTFQATSLRPCISKRRSAHCFRCIIVVCHRDVIGVIKNVVVAGLNSFVSSLPRRFPQSCQFYNVVETLSLLLEWLASLRMRKSE